MHMVGPQVEFVGSRGDWHIVGQDPLLALRQPQAIGAIMDSVKFTGSRWVSVLLYFYGMLLAVGFVVISTTDH